MDRGRIPTVDELTPAWFTDLLRSGGSLADDRSVTGVALAPLGHGESMMSSLQLATLDYDGATDAPRTLVVKLASAVESQRFVASMFKFYEREVRFYRELAATTLVRIPRCYLAEHHPTDPDFVLVLEDVGGRRQVDQVEGVGYEDAVRCVEALADLHAPNWGADLAALCDTFIPFDSPPLHALIPDVFTNFWTAARPLVADGLPAEVVALCDRFRDIAPDVLRAMNGPDTFIHGDFRIDNVLFDDAGPLVLDFQLAAVGNGAVDVSYLLGQSVRDDVAAAHAEELIDRYLARLATHGIDYPREQAMVPYQAALVFFLQIPLSMIINPELPARSKTLAEAMLRRAAAEIIRTRTHERFA